MKANCIHYTFQWFCRRKNRKMSFFIHKWSFNLNARQQTDIQVFQLHDSIFKRMNPKHQIMIAGCEALDSSISNVKSRTKKKNKNQFSFSLQHQQQKNWKSHLHYRNNEPWTSAVKPFWFTFVDACSSRNNSLDILMNSFLRVKI